jgi:hypothetical protein
MLSVTIKPALTRRERGDHDAAFAPAKRGGGDFVRVTDEIDRESIAHRLPTLEWQNATAATALQPRSAPRTRIGPSARLSEPPDC